ncbi:hypothetical protein B6U99_07510 [Candidatus Geothermarchaeota archaeon ex4572_27]|nr:MAG: hypothetical protein B6U99_07510 [Candidatus Geothermarchaeota archaeon ex4572_27]
MPRAGATLTAPMAVAALYGELRALGSFAASSLALLVVGGLLTLATPSVEEVIVPQALLFSSMAWLVAAGALPLALSGLMTPLDAICHAMTALATGGLSTRTANIGAFNSPIIEAVLIAFMLVGATNFHVHLDVLRGRLREALSSMELQAMLAIVAAATALVSLDLVVHLHLPLSDAVRASVFQVASIATTTGYTSIDVNVLPPASRWTLICLMVVGGCLCSTAGGIKVARAVALAKMAKLEVHTVALAKMAKLEVHTLTPPNQLQHSYA